MSQKPLNDAALERLFATPIPNDQFLQQYPPKTGTYYDKVQVLLLYWHHSDDSEYNDAKATGALASCFKNEFGFEVEIFAIGEQFSAAEQPS